MVTPTTGVAATPPRPHMELSPLVSKMKDPWVKGAAMDPSDYSDQWTD